MVPISYQLYSSRNFDEDETLAMLSRLNIGSVEGYGPWLQDVEATRRRLDRHELQMPSAHFAYDRVVANCDECLQTARALGIGTILVPYLTPEQRPANTEGWRALGQSLIPAAQRIRDAGLGFGWHNHDFEFQPCADGSLPIEHLLDSCPEMGLELDLAWVQVAGQDPAQWVRAKAERLLIAHVKDVAAEGENADEDGWADVGHGIMDWPSIALALDSAQVPRYILEHDNPLDHERFAQRSLETVQAFNH